MRELNNIEVRPKKKWPMMSIAAALLGAAVVCQPDVAQSAHGGGGGFHGGGFHSRGFHGGGFHGGYFHRSGTYYAYPWWGSYPDYGYYDYSQPSGGQTWYYCSDPAGYYPFVTRCNTGWQAVPAS